MGALELIWFVLLLVFAFVGVVRGYPKELGVTASILVALLALTEWGGEILASMDSLLQGTVGASLLAVPQANLFQAGFYISLFVAMVFLAYHGETLAFRGNPPEGPWGVLMNTLSGAANGYLIAGTIWYYLDRFNYPISVLGLFSPPLTDLAKSLLPFLPLPMLQPYLLPLVVFLILVRIFR
jgi:hypothetical protein